MNSQPVVHSNAFNFLSFIQNGVDPRTGQYTLNIELPALNGNHLLGPNLPLRLAFNALTAEDTGFGKGWSLNLSQYTPSSNTLSTHTGEQFYVDGGGAQPTISEQKLKSFHFHDDGDGLYRVVHRSGLVEQLKVIRSNGIDIAVPYRVYAPSGHWIELSHEGQFGGHRCLSRVVDGDGLVLLSVTYTSTLITFHLHPDHGQTCYQVELTDRWVKKVILPSDDASVDRASWRFDYASNASTQHMTCLTRVETPLGGIETISYDDAGHQQLQGAPVPRIPRVKSLMVDPGANQPALTTTYGYSTNNFLGFGSGLKWEKDQDNLYRAGNSFTYETTLSEASEGKELRRSLYRYNRHHLLTLQTSEQYGDVIEDVINDVPEAERKQDWHIQETETVYHEIPGASFAAQPNNFQQPYTATQRWRLKEDSTRLREEVTTTEYDTEHGNLTREEKPNGIVTAHVYYDKAGEEGCPPDPQGFQRNIKQTTTLPSAQAGVEGEAATLVKHFRYTSLTTTIYRRAPKLRRQVGEYWLEVEEEALYEGSVTPKALLSKTTYLYIDSNSDSVRHGRVSNKTFEMNETLTVTEYDYHLLAEDSTVLETTQTLIGFDHEEAMEDGGLRDSSQEIKFRHSVLIDEPVLDRDDNDIEIAYRYDALRRVLEETVSPNDPKHKASRRYEYYLSSALGQQASQIEYDVKGVATRTYVNGQMNVINVERHDADAAQDEQRKTFRTSYEGHYDAFGNLIGADEYDWLGEQDRKLPSSMLFNAWNQQYCTVGPDDVRHYELTDLIGTGDSGKRPVKTHWTQSKDGELKSGKTITWLNLFDKPVQVQRVRVDGVPESLHRYYYDGLGRTAREVDGRDAVVRFSYDEFDRLVKHTQADNSVVLREYASFTHEDKPVKISVNEKLLGEQSFDGVGRMIKSETGGRIKEYYYSKGYTEPSRVKTAKGLFIDYEYVPKVGEEPTKRCSTGVNATFDYDPANARLVSSVENNQTLQRQYFSTGELSYEKRFDGAGETYEMHYEKSLRGREISYTDVSGVKQLYFYDDAGRLARTGVVGGTHALFTYDALGRMETSRTVEGDQWLETTLTYDDFNREIKRVFKSPGEEQALVQHYDGCDSMVKRTLHGHEDSELRDEEYGYDERGRLISYICSGPLSPVDPYGKVISSQDFVLDEIDNITYVTTRFIDAPGSPELKNIATYGFGNSADPAQLTSISNSHADYPPFIKLEYDADGNLTLDEQQRTYTYDVYGRLSSVTLPDGRLCDYGYDPKDRLASQAEGV